MYAQKINEMCSKNKSSLEVDFNHLDSKHPTLSMWIVTEPNVILPYLNDVALECAKKYFPDYGEIHAEIFIRIDNYPVQDKIRDLRHKDLG